MTKENTLDIDQLLRIALTAGLVYWSFCLTIPVLPVLTWGFILAIALYPIFKWLNKSLKNSILSAIIITLVSIIVLVGSVVILTDNMIENLSDITTKMYNGEQIIPDPPDFIKDWPFGDELHNIWATATYNFAEVVKKYSPFLIETSKILLAKTLDMSLAFILFVISVLFSGYLLIYGDTTASTIRKLSKRLAPQRGIILSEIMIETIQNVSRGVIGLSFLQSLILGLLLLIAEMPGAGLITFLAFILCVAQLGQFIVIIPIIIWLFMTKSIFFASIISALLIIDGLLDNFLKPFILARGLRTPTLIIFLGVVGGIITHGLIGVFIGPVVLAIFYDLVMHWGQEPTKA